MARLPGIESRFAEKVTRFMQEIRGMDLLKRPGVSETLDWARALMAMQREYPDEDVVVETRGCILKYQEDIKRFKEEIWVDNVQRAHFLGMKNP